MSTASLILINYTAILLVNAFTNLNLKDTKQKFFFFTQDRVVSSASTRIFYCVISDAAYLDFHFPNFIYLITSFTYCFF